MPDPTFLNSRFLRVLVCFLAAKRKLRALSCPLQREGVSSPRPARFACAIARTRSKPLGEGGGRTNARPRQRRRQRPILPGNPLHGQVYNGLSGRAGRFRWRSFRPRSRSRRSRDPGPPAIRAGPASKVSRQLPVAADCDQVAGRPGGISPRRRAQPGVGLGERADREGQATALGRDDDDLVAGRERLLGHGVDLAVGARNQRRTGCRCRTLRPQRGARRARQRRDSSRGGSTPEPRFCARNGLVDAIEGSAPGGSRGERRGARDLRTAAELGDRPDLHLSGQYRGSHPRRLARLPRGAADSRRPTSRSPWRLPTAMRA